ncbi:MAG: endo-1,4-beta-xylanase [Pirellulales bacterium]|nr:endo-1,4-beta-xylanase [Pirellulales bacterium]
MRFSVQNRARLGRNALERIHVCGLDEIPWRSRAAWDGDLLVIHRDTNESGRVVVPWCLTDRGEHAISTATLIERQRPYLLEVELARGSLNEVRTHIAAWTLAGLMVPAKIELQVSQATQQFADAATSQDHASHAAALATEIIEKATEVAYQLATSYTEQVLRARRSAAYSFSTLLGINLGSNPPTATIAGHLAGTFSLAAVPFGWRTIEAVEGKRLWNEVDEKVHWCQRTGIKISGGPLLNLDAKGVPDWMYLWEGDFDTLLSFMLDHVKAVVSRYRGRVHLWQAASRCNAASPLGLDEEQTLRIVVRTVEAIQELDPRTPILVLFDQPWSEYMAEHDYDLTSLHFADALIRANIGLAGVGLEINAGYWPGGTPHRNPLAYIRLIDHWSLLGVPLMVSLTTPSAEGADLLANLDGQVLTAPGGLSVSSTSQQAWIETMVPLLLAKNSIQVVLWNQLDDGAPHDFPHGGLIETSGEPKSSLLALRTIRQRYLM